MYISFLVYLAIIFHVGNSAKILFVSTPHDASHEKLLAQLYRELTSNDHHVHVLTHKPLNNSKLPELHQYDLSDLNEDNEAFAASKCHLSEEADLFTTLSGYNNAIQAVLEHVENVLRHAETQRLLKENETFDACVVEWSYPILSLLSAYFNCSVIGISSQRPTIPALDALGNPSHPIASPDYLDLMSISTELTYYQRITSVLWTVYVRLYHYWVVLPKEDVLLKKYLGYDLPNVGETNKLISVFLLTSSPGLPFPKLPTIVDLGLVEDDLLLQEIDPDLSDFLNTSPNGVVYLNFGPGVRLKDLPPRVEETLALIFMHMTYDWIWEYDGDDFHDEYVNLRIRSSIPEAALYHPNIKLFMVNGELQSLKRAKAARKPVIGVSFGSEQSSIIDAAVSSGAGFRLDVKDIMYSTLASYVIDIFRNSSYTEKAEELADDDSTVGFPKVVERAAWWIEHVIRTHGATHIRSAAVGMPWWKYLMVDVVSFILMLVLLVILIIKIIIKLLLLLVGKILSYLKIRKVRSNKKTTVNEKKLLQKKKKKE